MGHPKTPQCISLHLRISKCPETADDVAVDCLQLRSPRTTEAGDIFDYEDSKADKSLMWLISLLATIAMSLLPSLIILWLFHVKRTIVRIWITMGATIIIGILLSIFTTATMKEIFGGTAAYVFPYIYWVS